MSLPVVGREYDYLDTIVKVTRVVPCKGASDDEATVYFETRFADRGQCEAGELTERMPPKGRGATVAIVAFLAVLLFGSSADACDRCGLFGNRCAFRHVAVQQVIAQPLVAYPQVNYFVGAPIRVEAIVQQVLRQDPEYAEFQRFRVWKQQQTAPQQAERKWYETPENKVPHEDGWEDHIKPIGSMQADGTVKPVSQLVLKEKCGSCHGGDAPKKGLLLDGTAKLTCEQALKAMRAVQDGTMPPKGTLSGEERGDVWQELLGLTETK